MLCSQVSFSKRRSGLFKKACELSILCGAHVAVIVFSPAKKPFSFIHPSVPSVLDRYLSSSQSPDQPDYYYCSQEQLLDHASASDADAVVSNLSSQLAELTTVLEAAKRRKEALKERLHTLELGNVCMDIGDVSRLGWTELNDLKTELERVKADVLARADELCVDDGGGFTDATTSFQSNAVYGYGFACNDDGAMLLPASSVSVSDYTVPPVPAYRSDYGCTYGGQIFV